MKVQIKRERQSVTILSLMFFLIFLFDYQIFYLFPFPNWMAFLKNNQLNIVTGLVGIVTCMIYYARFKKQNRKLYYNMVSYGSLCVLIWFVLVVYSVVVYWEQPLRSTLGAHSTFLYMTFCIPLLVIFYNAKKNMKIFDIINIIAVLWYVIIIYQHIVYAASGAFVFNIQELILSSSRDVARTYGIRISLKSLGNIAILYNFDNFFNNKKRGAGRVFSFIALVLGLYCLFMIQQTRAMTFTVLCSIAAIMLFGAKRVIKKLIVFSVAIIALGTLIYTGVLSNFFESFSTAATNANREGTTIRISAILYYIECFFKNPILGNGFTNDFYYPQVQHGSLMMFYYSDVGIFGLLGEVGLMSIPLYFYPLYRIIRNTYKMFRIGKLRDYGFLAGLTVFLILTSISLVITATNLMIAFPVIYTYSEYVYATKVSGYSN